MKKYFIFAAAAIVAASCAKTPAPVQTPDGPEAPAVEGKEVIQFGSNVVANVETKAAVEAWNGQQLLYIYGFPRVMKGEPASLVTDYEHPYINNVKASAPTSDAENNKIEVIDASKSGNTTPYYYEGTTTYDFFGYYVQDAAVAVEDDAPKPTINGTNDGYELAIKIKGTQDIMTAIADPTSACDKVFGADPTPRPEGWNDKYAFSAYAARRGVQPILQFKHELTQLVFMVESGTNFTDATQLHVIGVKINNVPVNAKLCVAGANAGTGDGKAVTITDVKNESGKYDSSIDVYVDDDHILASGNAVKVPKITEDAIAVGQPVMLFPEESKYSVTLTVAQGTATSEVTADITRDVMLDVNGTTPFQPGFSYKVTFKVYGLESIDIKAELTPWQTGTPIDINTDDKPTIE